MCRVALDGGTGGDSSGGSEEESGSDEHRRGGGSPVPVDEQELDEEDAGAPSAAAEGAVNPQVARLRAVLEDPTANPRCLFGEAGWAVLRLWQTGKASAKVVDDLLASLGAATVPAPGYAQLPFSRASDVRRALEGYAAQHHLGFEARDIRFENGLHQLTTRTMYVRSGVGLIGEWFRAAELAGVARYGFEELRNEDGDRVYRGPLSGEWARHACGSLPEPDKATLFAVHIFSDKTTEKAQSFYPMVMQNCQLPLDERRKPENCLVIALLPVLKKRELSANEAANRRMRAALQTRCWLEALRTLGLAPEEGEASWDMASLAGVSMRDARGHPHTVYVRLELLQLDHPEAAAACGCFQTRCPHCRAHPGSKSSGWHDSQFLDPDSGAARRTTASERALVLEWQRRCERHRRIRSNDSRRRRDRAAAALRAAGVQQHACVFWSVPDLGGGDGPYQALAQPTLHDLWQGLVPKHMTLGLVAINGAFAEAATSGREKQAWRRGLRYIDEWVRLWPGPFIVGKAKAHGLSGILSITDDMAQPKVSMSTKLDLQYVFRFFAVLTAGLLPDVPAVTAAVLSLQGWIHAVLASEHTEADLRGRRGLSLRLKRAQSAAFGEAPFRRSVKAHRAVGCRERIDGDHERQYGAAVESNEEAGEAKHKELKDIFRFRTNRRAPEAQIVRNLAEKDAFYALRRWPQAPAARRRRAFLSCRLLGIGASSSAAADPWESMALLTFADCEQEGEPRGRGRCLCGAGRTRGGLAAAAHRWPGFGARARARGPAAFGGGGGRRARAGRRAAAKAQRRCGCTGPALRERRDAASAG